MQAYASVFFASLVTSVSAHAQADVLDKVLMGFRTGNTQQISQFLAPAFDLTLVDQEDNFTKAQGSQVLKEFFKDNAPQKVQLIHKTNSVRNYRFMVFRLFTARGLYRVAVTLKNAGSALYITELRIELSKD